MIGGISSGTLTRTFRDRTDVADYRRRLDEHYRSERRTRERREDIADNAAELAEAALVLATTESIAEFQSKLDRYEADTIVAMQENERQLTLVKEEHERVLAQAYLLPDGRRVFKTRDGLRVFDESGQELGRDELDPEMIEGFRPKWEDKKALDEERTRLEQQHAEYESRLSKIEYAREVGRRPGVEQQELDRLMEDIESSAPEANAKYAREQTRVQTPAIDDDQSYGVDASSRATRSALQFGAPGPTR